MRATETGCAELIEAKLPALRELCREFGVRRLDLFGSAATGRFDPGRSDLDFLVEFEEEAPRRASLRLLEALEQLLGRKVDLLTEPGLKNPYLRRRIETERRPLFPVAMIYLVLGETGTNCPRPRPRSHSAMSTTSPECCFSLIQSLRG